MPVAASRHLTELFALYVDAVRQQIGELIQIDLTELVNLEDTSVLIAVDIVCSSYQITLFDTYGQDNFGWSS